MSELQIIFRKNILERLTVLARVHDI